MLQITVGRVVDGIDAATLKKEFNNVLYISCLQIFQLNNEISCRVADCCFSEFVCLENSRKSKCHKTSNQRPGNSVIKDNDSQYLLISQTFIADFLDAEKALSSFLCVS